MIIVDYTAFNTDVAANKRHIENQFNMWPNVKYGHNLYFLFGFNIKCPHFIMLLLFLHN